MARMRTLRAHLSDVDSVARFAGLGVDVFIGEGAFTGADTLTVGGATLRFRRAIIATGARAARPPIPGLSERHRTTPTSRSSPLPSAPSAWW
jgi:pyruvate/2-oxoglutarate dehydrogenase complex dihydrolipoamide dehydrogenase (E3) component